MTIVGFDVGKKELVGSLINKRGQEQKTFILPNKEEELCLFLDKLKQDGKRFLVASESTAEYHLPLARACFSRNVSFKLINPIVTKQFTRATIRKKKTDISDALIIAKLALQNEGYLFRQDQLSEGKALCRTRQKVTGMITKIIAIQRRMESTFANLNLSEVFEAPLETLKSSRTKLEELALEYIDPKLKKLLCSVPGVGPNISITIISEINPLERFSSGKALVAYAGLDPKVRQSGTSLHRNTRLTKRGPSGLRRDLFLAASIAQRYDPELKQYYEKKRAEGKSYRVATIAVARKLTHRIYAVWKRNTPYLSKEKICVA